MTKSTERPEKNASGEPKDNRDKLILEELFPDPEAVFEPHVVPPLTDENVLVALDASALLLPYKINLGSLEELGKVYERLGKKKRLFIPARSAREFAKNRNTELTNLLQALRQRRSACADLPPILAGMSGYKAVMEGLKRVRPAYGELEEVVKNWRADDPVSRLYADVFRAATFVEIPLGKKAGQELLRELSRRYDNAVPPGYKDASKEDGGIGDLIIWKTLLQIGNEEKKHLVFVTGEEKSDWFNRSGGGGVYPRFELLDEYRRASGGKAFGLIGLPLMLEQMKAPQAVVKDVRAAERAARALANSEFFNSVVSRALANSAISTSPQFPGPIPTNVFFPNTGVIGPNIPSTGVLGPNIPSTGVLGSNLTGVLGPNIPTGVIPTDFVFPLSTSPTTGTTDEDEKK